jgi:aspartate oxidase
VRDVARRFPGVTTLLARHGLDLARELIPVAPALHYAMGGIRTGLDGRATRPGLWAVGEVACTGAHGANRLASNSLLEAVVFADRAARSVASRRGWRGALRPPPLSADLADERADDRAAPARQAMRALMTASVGVERHGRALAQAERTLADLAAGVPRAAWRTRNQLLVARRIAAAARRRRESRGGHERADFPRTHQPAAVPAS